MKPLFPYRIPLCLSLIAAAALPCALPELSGVASAEFRSTGDAGANRLDFIENRHRTERENRLTDAQVETVQDAQEMQKHLRYPVDPEKAAPTSFEGDELTYDQVTGEFTAVGHVRIVQADAHSFASEDSVRGNTKSEQIELPGKAHVVQMTHRLGLHREHALRRAGFDAAARCHGLEDEQRIRRDALEERHGLDEFLETHVCYVDYDLHKQG